MQTMPSPSRVLKFGVFEVDLQAKELRRSGMRQKLAGQPFQVLQLLLERPQEVVTREELRQHIWPGNTFVDYDLALKKAVNRLREVLGDSAESPRFIETIPRRGYRFVAPVEAVGDNRNRPPEISPLALGHKWRPWTKWAGALVAALAVTAVLIVGSVRRHAPKSNSTAKRVMLAVLPFDNFTGDSNQEYLADGLTEEVIGQLGSLDPARLGVIARTSAMKYKKSGKGIDQVGHELNVDYVLEGSMRESDNHVRITAQLIRSSDQTHVWSQTFDRSLRSLLDLENEIARAIASRVDSDLVPHAAVESSREVSWEAYSAYLKGRHILLDTKTDESTGVAMQYFQRAISMDPKFALAYAGLADAYQEQADQNLAPSIGFQRSREAARKALELDPNLAEGHVAMANVLASYDWNRPAAEKEYLRALQLKPTYEEAHHSYSHFLMAAGRHDEAISESKRLLELDPLSSHMNAHMGLAFLRAGRLDEGVEQLNRTVRLDPTYIRGYLFLAFGYGLKHMYLEALETVKKAVALQGDTIEALPQYAYVLVLAGHRAEGLRILHHLESNLRRQYVSPFDLATIHVALGERDKALALLETAYRERSRGMVYVNVEPEFAPLHSDPRFQAIVARMGESVSRIEAFEGGTKQIQR